ncbi:hypothetical protein GCM10009107_32630 [Ideonella azotifigens]|uniref:DUF1289 domain-containing protein n=1 Tax=Ideonella azotifigens TaxID=513160 RepID=A0ABP3VHI1_9BURK
MDRAVPAFLLDAPPVLPADWSAGQPVPSPCISVCRMDPATGWCEGCLRSIDEIIAWSRQDEAGKLQVWARLPGRWQQQQEALFGPLPPSPGAS